MCGVGDGGKTWPTSSLQLSTALSYAGIIGPGLDCFSNLKTVLKIDNKTGVWYCWKVCAVGVNCFNLPVVFGKSKGAAFNRRLFVNGHARID